jgi:hypothetical protein
LNLQYSNEVNHHLDHQENVGQNFDIVITEDLKGPVGNQACSMSQKSQVHKGIFLTSHELSGFSGRCWASTIDLEKGF